MGAAGGRGGGGYPGAAMYGAYGKIRCNASNHVMCDNDMCRFISGLMFHYLLRVVRMIFHYIFNSKTHIHTLFQNLITGATPMQYGYGQQYGGGAAGDYPNHNYSNLFIT